MFLFQSFFGRSYNNISSITPCKNSGRCVINKKNRTSCKACRLKKCIGVGMSKGGSRYGRRSNWFKIHCLLEQEQNESRRMSMMNITSTTPPPRPNTWPMDFLAAPHYDHRSSYAHHQKSPKEDTGYEEYKNASSPTISSPESHNSDSSVEIGERVKPHLSFYKPEIKDFPSPYLPFGTLASLQSILHNPSFLPPLFPNNHLLFPPSLVCPKPDPLQISPDSHRKRLHLDAILRSHSSPVPSSDKDDSSPIDLTVRPVSREEAYHSDEDEHITVDEDDHLEESHVIKITSPLDLTTKVQ